MDPMEKMWVSFAGIGLMVLAAVIISFARLKTKGVIRLVLSLVAFASLVLGFLFGAFSIM